MLQCTACTDLCEPVSKLRAEVLRQCEAGVCGYGVQRVGVGPTGAVAERVVAADRLQSHHADRPDVVLRGVRDVVTVNRGDAGEGACTVVVRPRHLGGRTALEPS